LRRWFLLLGLSVAAAISIVVAVHPWEGPRALRFDFSRSREHPAQKPLGAIDLRHNVAVQSGGPPDPVAQKTAAGSAQKAAERAAALAASAATN